VYLDCKVAGDAEEKKFSVTLDESTTQVTHTGEKGGAFNTKGFFTANTISYQNVTISGGIKLTFQYEVNRTNLGIIEMFVIEPADPKYADKIPPKRTTMMGACTVVKVSGRKI